MGNKFLLTRQVWEEAVCMVGHILVLMPEDLPTEQQHLSSLPCYLLPATYDMTYFIICLWSDCLGVHHSWLYITEITTPFSHQRAGPGGVRGCLGSRGARYPAGSHACHWCHENLENHGHHGSGISGVFPAELWAYRCMRACYLVWSVWSWHPKSSR